MKFTIAHRLIFLPIRRKLTTRVFYIFFDLILCFIIIIIIIAAVFFCKKFPAEMGFLTELIFLGP